MLSTNGDTFPGGEDFDQRLMDHPCDEFKKDQGIGPKKDARLCSASEGSGSESAKIESCLPRSKLEVNLPYITGRRHGAEAPT